MLGKALIGKNQRGKPLLLEYREGVLSEILEAPAFIRRWCESRWLK